MSADTHRATSYTAANSLPLKLMAHPAMHGMLAEGKLHPLHVQFIPTDRCNLKCAFCSCANDSRKTTMPMEQADELIRSWGHIGVKSATVTGGGEPCLHPEIEQILLRLQHQHIAIGLVSNGYGLRNLSGDGLRRFTWCRISGSDDRPLDGKLLKEVELAVQAAPGVDWAFSYVLTKDADYDALASYVRFANNYRFTHVRVVSDLLDLDRVPDLAHAKAALQERGVDDHLILYQGRKGYTSGARMCWIALVKPVIGADGLVYPCCGVQYALKEPTRSMPPELCMGTWNDYMDYVVQGKPFDGTVCHRCYYDNYNQVLHACLEGFEHQDFI